MYSLTSNVMTHCQQVHERLDEGAPMFIDMIDHVGISVRDLRAAHAFYSEVLGFEVGSLDEAAGFFIARLGDTGVTVTRTSASSAGPVIVRSGLWHRSNPPGLDRLLFKVSDFDRA